MGITGKYSDRRDVIQAASNGDERAELAISVEAYRLKKYIGGYLGILGRVDAVVFTAGVGEMGPLIRARCMEGLDSLGIRIDTDKNVLSKTRNGETDITAKNSRIKVFVIPTDEELVMTEDTQALLAGNYKKHTEFTYSFQNTSYVNYERELALKEEIKRCSELGTILAKL